MKTKAGDGDPVAGSGGARLRGADGQDVAVTTGTITAGRSCTGGDCLELARLREQLSMVLDIAPVGIWMQNGQGRLSFVNRAFCEATGIAEAEYLAVEHYKTLLPAEFVPTCLASDDKALASDGPTVTIQQLPLIDGQVHDLEVYKAVRRNTAGEPVALVGVAVEATARLADAQALRRAKETAESLSHAKSEFINLMSHEFLTPIHGILGLTEALLGDEPAADRLEMVQGIRAAGDKLRRIAVAMLEFSRLEVRPAEQTRAPFNVAKIATALFDQYFLRDAGARPSAVPTVFSLPTNHGDDLVLAVQRKLETCYAQPLTAQRMAEWVRPACARTLQRRFVAALGMTPSVCAQRIRLFKAREMLENTRYSLEKIAFDVGYKDVATFRERFCQEFNMLPSRCRRRFARSGRQNDIVMACEIDPAADRVVFGDKPAVERVLSALLRNARDFTRRGEIRLFVNVGIEQDGKVAVSFALVDTGSGIPKNFMPHLFTPFKQAESTLTRFHDGIGLDLALGKRLVDRMGGELAIESAEGQGTTARLRLTFDTQ